MALAWTVEGHSITTVAGLGDGEHPHPLQEAFVEHGAVQCGFCIPGQLVSAQALLALNPHPTRADVEEGLFDLGITGRTPGCPGTSQARRGRSPWY